MEKMRLLSLASIASVMVSGSLLYGEVASALDVAPEDVENWLIKGFYKYSLTRLQIAIHLNLIEGKLNQLEQRIVISRSYLREFDDSQWKTLKVTLSQWRVKLKDIVGNMVVSKLPNHQMLDSLSSAHE